MKLSPSLVAVKDITSPQPLSSFSPSEIEELAQLIIGVEGLINPLIVRRTGLKSFEVVEGHKEYYAAARAREINLRQGEVINAFILEEQNEENLLKQVELLRKSAGVSAEATTLESRLSNLESILMRGIEEIKADQKEVKKQTQSVSTEIVAIKERLPQPLEPLLAFNTMEVNELATKLQFSGRYGQKEANNIATAIIQERQKNGDFQKLSEVIKRVKRDRGNKKQRAIGEPKMLEILDNWS